MKFLILAYGKREAMQALTKEQFGALVAECGTHDAELKATGSYLQAMSLEWDSVVIRPRGGKTVTTDGPYAETKEQIGGIVMIEAPNLEEAVRLAKMHPAAKMGEKLGWGIELRPIADGCHQ
jgi:hypothetical protein